MCGRFVAVSSPRELAARFDAVDTTDGWSGPRYNVAPSTPVLALIGGQARRLGPLHWGYVPPWASTPDSGPRPINARSEGAARSRLFGSALTHRRCAVPVDSWYEWTEEGGALQPWLLTPEGEAPVAIAGLWSTWRDLTAGQPASAALGTVALLTTTSAGRAADVHHRMPLAVPDDLLDDWLDPGRTQAQDLLALLSSRPVEIHVTKVSRRVNDVREDDASLLDPVAT